MQLNLEDIINEVLKDMGKCTCTNLCKQSKTLGEVENS